MILHCMKESSWNEAKRQPSFGTQDIKQWGFIHCSPVAYFWRIAPNFRETTEPLVLLCIDENKLVPKIKYEDGDHCGRAYPHVYGEINTDSVMRVLPFLRNEKGDHVKNPEFEAIKDE